MKPVACLALTHPSCPGVRGPSAQILSLAARHAPAPGGKAQAFLAPAAYLGFNRAWLGHASPARRRDMIQKCIFRVRNCGGKVSEAMSPDGFSESLFEERAEYLSSEELHAWTTRTDRDDQILDKLTGPGPKLLIGPRGSGKSTYLRLAYYRLLESKQALPVYVNYAKSLALEPNFHRNANALSMFRQWVLARIVVAISESIGKLGEVPLDLKAQSETCKQLIKAVEARQVPDSPPTNLTPSGLLEDLERWTSSIPPRRTVLLFDDAAHAFSSEQQREFFEIFTQLRSRYVACKAAVYPGVTNYTPTFQLGHDAQLIEAWMRPDDQEYLSTMRDIASRRLPVTEGRDKAVRDNLVDYIAVASFGIPRGFLLMLSELLGLDETSNLSPTKRIADESVENFAQSTRDVFDALALKLPRYKRFIEVGKQLQVEMVAALTEFNGNRPDGEQRSAVVALQEPLSSEISRVLAFLEYAGLVRDLRTVNHGAYAYRQYWVHHAVLLHENALGLGRNPSAQAAVAALTGRATQSRVRRGATSLLGADYMTRCTLDLPPCDKCGEPRAAAEAQYCLRCGNRLTDASVFEELLRAPVDKLPLTQNKRQGILQHTKMRTVQDVLLDVEQAQLRSIPNVGPVWASRITRYAEEFVYV